MSSNNLGTNDRDLEKQTAMVLLGDNDGTKTLKRLSDPESCFGPTVESLASFDYIYT